MTLVGFEPTTFRLAFRGANHGVRWGWRVGDGVVRGRGAGEAVLEQIVLIPAVHEGVSMIYISG